MNKTTKSNTEAIVSTERIIHSETQITETSQIQLGVAYYRHGRLGTKKIIFVGFGKDYMVSDTGVNYYLADMGIIPYPSGKWHKFNWLEEA